MQDDTVVVRTASGEFEAQQVRAFLEAHDIPCELHGEALRNTHGLTVDGLGRVELRVPPAHAARAEELLASVDRGDLRIDDWAD